MNISIKGLKSIDKGVLPKKELIKIIQAPNTKTRNFKHVSKNQITDTRTYKNGTIVEHNYIIGENGALEKTTKQVFPINCSFKFITSYFEGKFRRTSLISEKNKDFAIIFEKKNGKMVQKTNFL